ncbi:DUF551 domain-containing protein [Legionella sainthelensi]|uniref:DUF551 domain-containing protein n=1 Tax=Legionella sainthelensi TaxID=28087 RepID=UPI000E202628|nr:DUF551 domain-containing protein [Legionella sainthelensi]
MDWISVSDSLPPKENDYLTVVSYAQIQICRFNPSTKKWDNYRANAGVGISVTHWMDLPPLPK